MSVKPDDEKYRIHRALEAANGDRKVAAAELGITVDELKNNIHNCKDLKLTWSKDGCNATVTPPEEVDLLHRQPLIPPMGPQPEEVMQEIGLGVAKEDHVLRQGLSKMGLTEKEQQLAMELQEFNRKSFSRSLDITSAGVTRQAIKIVGQLDKITERLDFVRQLLMDMGEAMTEDRPMWVQEEKDLTMNYTLLNDQLRKMMGVQYEATKTLAYIKFHSKNQKPEKAGFSTAIPVNAV